MPYGALILAALLFEYVVEMVGDVLNLRALQPQAPAALAGLYEPERYAQSQAYTRARIQFGWLPRAINLAAMLAAWQLGGFAWLDGFVRRAGAGDVLTGVYFIGALVFVQGLLALPFQCYSTFVIEARYGFNRTTPATFVLDLVKGLGLAVALGGPLLAAVLWLFARAGDAAWLWCLAVTSAFVLVLQFVAPTWLMPLFNTFRPLEDGALARAVRAAAAQVAFPVEHLFVVDGSRRSAKANAFLSGFGSRRRIGLFDTLVERHTSDEIVAVVLHEIGHHKLGHILRGTAISLVEMALMFFLLGHVIGTPAVFSAFHVAQPSVHVGLVLFAVIYAPVSLVLSLASQAYERRCEFEADAYARASLGSGEALVSALERLSAESLTNLTPHPFFVRLHYSHPPLAERVAALRA